jgi:hypothetical protein
MNKREFFLKGLHAGAALKRTWVNSLMSVVVGQAAGFHVEPYPYQVRINEQGMFFNDPERGGEVTYLEDYTPGEPLLHFLDEFILNPGELVNYVGDQPLVTTYGNVLVNYMMLVLPFGATIPFIAGQVDVEKQVESEIVKRLIDDPVEDDGVSPAPDGKIYVRQYLKFCDYALSLMAYGPLVVTSVSPKSLQGHPDRDKVRAEEMEKNKDRLDDPATVAKIGARLGELDMEWLKDDPSFGFYMSNKGKLLDAARKRQFYMFGGESPFEDGTSVQFIHKSLEEGIDTDHMTVMNNSTRAGSYNRGAQTKLGGESTKTIYRMLGTTRIVEDDCGTPFGIPTKITAFNKKRMTGYYIQQNGKSLLLTDENIDQYVGKIVDMRSAMSCRTGRNAETGEPGKGKNVCAACMGTALSEQPNGLSAATAGLGGRFLTLFLKKMHGSTLRTTHWDLKERIT